MIWGLALSVGARLVIAAGTPPGEQRIRIQLKNSVIQELVPEWLAAGGDVLEIVTIAPEVGKRLAAGDLVGAEVQQDRLITIVAGSTAPAQLARVAALAVQINGLQDQLHDWLTAGGDESKVSTLYEQLGPLIGQGTVTMIEAHVNKIVAVLTAPLPSTTDGTAPVLPPPSSPPPRVLVTAAPMLYKNSAPGERGFTDLMDLLTQNGANFFIFGGGWADLEPSAGQFLLGPTLVQPLTYMLARYPQFTGFGLSVTMLNGAQRSLPPDLAARAFDDPQVLQRFDALIDAIAAEPLSRQLTYVLLGSEIEGGLHTPEDIDAFMTFYKRAVQRIHLRLPGVKVSSPITVDGALHTATQLFDKISAASDFVAYTYYPITASATGSWSMGSMTRVYADLAHLAERAGDKQFAFTEIGFTASPENDSSEDDQAKFVQEIFGDLEVYRRQGRIAFLVYHSLYDYPPDACLAYGRSQQVEALLICSFLEHLGLRSYATGAPHKAWDAFVQGAVSWSK
jgi:hypothetical protein